MPPSVIANHSSIRWCPFDQQLSRSLEYVRPKHQQLATSERCDRMTGDAPFAPTSSNKENVQEVTCSLVPFWTASGPTLVRSPSVALVPVLSSNNATSQCFRRTWRPTSTHLDGSRRSAAREPWFRPRVGDPAAPPADMEAETAGAPACLDHHVACDGLGPCPRRTQGRGMLATLAASQRRSSSEATSSASRRARRAYLSRSSQWPATA
jgi:hypothetical protein